MLQGFCLLTIWKKVKQLTLNIIVTFWINWTQKFVRKDLVCSTKKSFFTKTTAHKSVTRSMSKFNGLKYQLLDHPPYSPDLAPSDFYPFRNLKQFFRGKHFLSTEEAIAAVEAYFADLPGTHFRDGIK